MTENRLGDIVDDYCSKCTLLTNHAVVALVDDIPERVRCRTCYYEHKYRHGKMGTKKRSSNKKSDLFNEVLAKITGGEVYT
ncbi:MAG: hypothetical protein CMN58_04995 [Solibacterales bacterium]|nr:hypothetical protein [Bryobacterales bacterium]|tara:strand:- start:5276 stop:5518 length:243 start_codon:yes stop_codon:yes gene_type:complete